MATAESVFDTCSIGVTPNKLLSKIASELDKPDGISVLTLDDIPRRVWPLAVRKINFYGTTERNVTHYHQTIVDNVIHEIVADLEKSADYARRRREIRANGRPESEMNALFREELARTTAQLGGGPFAGKVGAFEGANYEAKGYYRPQADCIMFTRDRVPFCAVCQHAIGRERACIEGRILPVEGKQVTGLQVLYLGTVTRVVVVVHGTRCAPDHACQQRGAGCTHQYPGCFAHRSLPGWFCAG